MSNQNFLVGLCIQIYLRLCLFDILSWPTYLSLILDKIA